MFELTILLSTYHNRWKREGPFISSLNDSFQPGQAFHIIIGIRPPTWPECEPTQDLLV